jgi:hypothetical protein
MEWRDTFKQVKRNDTDQSALGEKTMDSPEQNNDPGGYLVNPDKQTPPSAADILGDIL